MDGLPTVKTYPNQKLIVIHKAVCDKEHTYTVINRKAMETAMKRMNGRRASGFLLWCYLSLNQEGYELALSNEAVKTACGMKKDAYDTAVSILMEEEYLVRKQGNTYDFYQFPNNIEPLEEEEKEG